MKYLHIKSLEEYNPGYQDRSLIWCKSYFKMINADHEFEMLCEIDKWRFVAFVMLELQLKKPVPLDESYLSRKGFELKKRNLQDTLNSLSKSIEIMTDLMQPVEINSVTQEKEESNDFVTQSRVEKSRVEKSRVDIYVAFEEATLTCWNNFCLKYPVLSSIKEMSGKRRDKLKNRFEKQSFKEFELILKAMEDQRFLFGENDTKWRVSFDWLIENDTNYLKVLEKKYLNHETESDMVKLKKKYNL